MHAARRSTGDAPEERAEHTNVPAAAASSHAGRLNPDPDPKPAPAFYDPYAPLDPHAPGSLPIRPFCKGRAPRKPRAPKVAPDDAACEPAVVPALPAAANALTFAEFECAPCVTAVTEPPGSEGVPVGVPVHPVWAPP